MTRTQEKNAWIYDLLLIVVLLTAAYFRTLGLDWDQGQHLHPDERFLTMVESALQPANSLREYLDTGASPLNPHNRGYGFFVYGTLPMFIVRYLAEWLGQMGYDQVHLVGRQVSAIADLGVIILLYAIASRLYGRKVALLASAFSAVTVMQIQQSHFFTVDNPANFFAYLATYFLVVILTKRLDLSTEADSADEETETLSGKHGFLKDKIFWACIAFGVAFGMALASKLNAAPMAVLLPAALVLYSFGGQRFDKWTLTNEQWARLIVYLVAGGLASLITFRIFQPYAFDGLGLNPLWLNNIRELRGQSSGDIDVPFALQWARRSHWYSFENMVKYGFGLPLGILAWIGFLYMGWRILKGEWKHILLWVWTALYFGWQSMAFNPTMRYQLPIYPLLAMMAAWAVWDLNQRFNLQANKFSKLISYGSVVAGVVVLILTTAWAYAFTRIYTRPHTRVQATEWIYQNLPGPINVRIGDYQQPLPFPTSGLIQPGAPYLTAFSANASGDVKEIYLPHVQDLVEGAAPQTLTVTMALTPDMVPDQILGRAVINLKPSDKPRGNEYTARFNQPIPILKNQSYFISIETSSQITLSGASPINETSWDDGLPLRMNGYDGFGGLYNGGLNLEIYWDDNADKVARLSTTLEQGDYIFITSNRQWASVTRIPERYPLTTQYYRWLIGCPDGEDVIWCYNVAKPGQFKGGLGYELVKVFESYPTLGPWQLNDQFAEEAFTVYDHTKVLIFKKSADFNPAKVQAMLASVDLSNVIRLTPKAASNYQSKSLMLAPDQLETQRAGGTWSQLFSYNWVQNKYPFVGVVVWYVFIFLLGLAAYPIARMALPGLKHHAYPLGRIVGLVLLAWVAWMGGSTGIPYTRTSISVALALVMLAGIGLWVRRRNEFKQEWDAHRRFFVMVEVIFFTLFLIDLLIRLGNSDMWHPSKGGERPMDFSYFNAVLKSTSFPPYDPWFAGGYINYYYYGFVLAGTPVKLLGIVPSIAYNFILPTWFALVGLGAFAAAYNIVDGFADEDDWFMDMRSVSGIAAALMTVLLGNLGTLKLIFWGFQRIAAPGGVVPPDAGFFEKWSLALQGVVNWFGGSMLPLAPGDWYWFPSRVIPAPNDVEPITEFPLFTFLYSDMHAHMLVMPITLFIIAWAVSFIKSRAQLRIPEWIGAFFIGALMIGALRPTNTWDLYTYYPLAALAVFYVVARYLDVEALLGKWVNFETAPLWLIRIVFAALAALGLYILGSLFYSPFTHWYSQGYGQVDSWWGSRTPISSYLTHWGLFLFIIVSWMIWETREWMAATPVSKLKALGEYILFIEMGIAALIAFLAYFAVQGTRIGFLALPLAAWAGILILRPDQPDIKRGVLLMIGTGLALSMAVEEVVLVGDIGRMNTVFKLYLQVWMLFAVSAAAAFGWLLLAFPQWTLRWRTVYQSGVYALLCGAFLFTLTATTDKISDRLTPDAPRTLDGMTFMKHSQLWDGDIMQLREDYDAIRWMQDHIQGSPVIVEANCTEYRWCTRYTIYTGLPGVIGWNWHQRQQRTTNPTLVTDRVADVGMFYLTTDVNWALDFIKKYDVSYIIVGQLERNLYPAVEGQDGLLKFKIYEGKYWRSVYQRDHTTIYEVVK